MGSLIWTQEVKWHAVLVAIHAHQGDPEIPSRGQVFLLTLNVARSFVFRVKYELETSGCHFASMAKRKKYSHTNFHTKFPSSVIIRGVVSSEGHVLPQHFLQEDLSQRCRLHRSAGDGSHVLDRPGGTGEAVRSLAGLRSSPQGQSDPGVAGSEPLTATCSRTCGHPSRLT